MTRVSRDPFWGRKYHAPKDWTLESYTYEQGPPPATGRKYGEDVAAFIRRLQIAELRKGPARDWMAQQKHEIEMQEKYEEAMKAKRARLCGPQSA